MITVSREKPNFEHRIRDQLSNKWIMMPVNRKILMMRVI